MKPIDVFKSAFQPRDLPQWSRLTIEAVSGITDLVEELHQTIHRMGIVPDDPDQKRTQGITGGVYRSIRTVTKLVDKGLDPTLEKISAKLDQQETSPAREALLAALNGVLGDHLVARNNKLAIPMQLRQDGKALDQQRLDQILQQSNGELYIFVHGLCMNDLLWRRKDHDHGAALAADLKVSPIYLHYNTGLHISDNGKLFANLLESIVSRAHAGVPLKLNIVAHSMGGLVTRSAHYYAEAADCRWPQHLRKFIALGTPHHGSYLEKGGNLIDVMLQSSSYSAPFTKLAKIRSSGITDLRHGFLVEEDWHGRDRFAPGRDARKRIPLPCNVACYAIAGTSHAATHKLADNLTGDGLVSVNSALGRHRDPKMDLAFSPDHQWIAREVHHMALLSDPGVYAMILRWLIGN